MGKVALTNGLQDFKPQVEELLTEAGILPISSAQSASAPVGESPKAVRTSRRGNMAARKEGQDMPAEAQAHGATSKSDAQEVHTFAFFASVFV